MRLKEMRRLDMHQLALGGPVGPDTRFGMRPGGVLIGEALLATTDGDRGRDIKDGGGGSTIG